VVAVASVTAISLFVDRLQSALIEQSATFLAADRVLSGSAPAPQAIRAKASELGLQQAETVTFATMLYTGADQNLLASVKAVSPEYPLRGVLRVSEEPFGADSEVRALPQPGEVWLDPRLFPALSLTLGDTVEVGFKTLTVTRVLTREPDRGGSFTDLAPRALMRIEDLDATKIVQPGSRVSFRYLLRGEDDDMAAAYAVLEESELKRFRWLGARDSSAAIGNALGRAESFLLLGGLLAVLLAGVAVALAAHRYSRRHFDHVGVLKTLGATPRVVLQNFLGVLLLVGGIGVLAGLLVGNLLQQAVLSALRCRRFLRCAISRRCVSSAAIWWKATLRVWPPIPRRSSARSFCCCGIAVARCSRFTRLAPLRRYSLYLHSWPGLPCGVQGHWVCRQDLTGV